MQGRKINLHIKIKKTEKKKNLFVGREWRTSKTMGHKYFVVKV